MSKTMEINKGTELMLRRKRPEPSPVIKRLGTDTSFFFLKRRLRFILELRWERADKL